jgi:uncharacterized protein YraI
MLAALSLLSSGCGSNIDSPPRPTATLLIITSTLPATSTARPSETAGPPTLAPTVTPVEGTTTTQVNVRGEPSTASPALGILNPFTKVQIVGKDPGGNWYQILYAQGAQGKGWATAAYIVTPTEPDVPVIGGGSGGAAPNNAIALQQINVRSGPGTDFNSLGTVNAQDVLALAGKSSNGAWLQIEFAAGPQGKGWVNAGFVQVTGPEAGNLPIITEAGEMVGTGTPAAVPPTITPTVVSAAPDNDSAAAPSVNLTFSPSGSGSLFYTGDVSAPEGDAEDWVQFTPYSGRVTMRLTCQGNGALRVGISRDGELLAGVNPLDCSSEKLSLEVLPGRPYLAHIQAQDPGGALHSVRYTLSISSVR